MRVLRRMRLHGGLYLMLLPVIAYFALFLYYPLARGFLISLQEFRMIGHRPFVGFAQYEKVLHDPAYGHALVNTLLIGGGQLALGFVAPIVLALSLAEVRNAAFRRSAQTVLYMPHLFSWVIVGGIWIYLLSPDGGFVNEALRLFGREKPVHFLAKPQYARWIMIGTHVWKETGYTCIIYLAAIVAINPSLYEAARIDGASRWQQLRYVTLPQFVPTMKVVLLLSVLGVLRLFDQIVVLGNPAIARQTDVLMTYVYQRGILQFEMDEASAASFLVIAATLLLTAAVRRIVRYDDV